MDGAPDAPTAPATQSVEPIKRSRLVWTRELHQRFEQAVDKAGGIDVAVPKSVLEVRSLFLRSVVAARRGASPALPLLFWWRCAPLLRRWAALCCVSEGAGQRARAYQRIRSSRCNHCDPLSRAGSYLCVSASSRRARSPSPSIVRTFVLQRQARASAPGQCNRSSGVGTSTNSTPCCAAHVRPRPHARQRGEPPAKAPHAPQARQGGRRRCVGLPLTRNRHHRQRHSRPRRAALKHGAASISQSHAAQQCCICGWSLWCRVAS